MTAGVESLDVSDNTLGAGAFEGLTPEMFPALRSLAAMRTGLGVSGVSTLGATAFAPRLRALNLGGNTLGPAAALALAALPLRSLHVLDLRDNPLGDAGLAHLLRAGWLAGLLHLDLSETDIGAAGAGMLVEAPGLDRLIALDLGGLTADTLDVAYHFDFLYAGNHDEVVAEALCPGGPLDSLAKHAPSRVLHYQPTLMLALDDGCQLQARLSVETRTTAYQVRTGNFPESPITVYFTIRQFWGKQPSRTFIESYQNQRRLLDELVTDHVLPNVIQPLARTIGAK